MKNIEENIKEVILKNAIEIVEKSGFEALTIRKLSEKTGKNLNAVNYYFGSKDKLELEIIKNFFDKVYGNFFIEDIKKYSMSEFLEIYMNMMIENRELFKKIFTILISGNVEMIKEISKYVNKKIKEAVKKIKDKKFESVNDKMVYFQEIAAIIYPILILEGVENMFGFDLRDENIRKSYINVLINKKGEKKK